MDVNATATRQSQAANTSSAASANASVPSGMFLTLLVTELKSQNPLSPLDPNEMVGQIVQLNTLDEVMKIRQVLEQMTGQQTASSAR